MKNPKAFPKTIIMMVDGKEYSRGGIDRLDNMIRNKDESMTLLDYFAGQVLTGIVSNANFDREIIPLKLAEVCYKQSEAMLKEREKRNG